MKALALLVVMTLGHVPRAYAADDAPLRCYTPVEVQRIADSKAAADRLAANDAARIRALEATVVKQHAGTVSVPLVVVLTVVAAAIGAGIGVGVAKATQPKP